MNAIQWTTAILTGTLPVLSIRPSAPENKTEVLDELVI